MLGRTEYVVPVGAVVIPQLKSACVSIEETNGVFVSLWIQLTVKFTQGVPGQVEHCINVVSTTILETPSHINGAVNSKVFQPVTGVREGEEYTWVKPVTNVAVIDDCAVVPIDTVKFI